MSPAEQIRRQPASLRAVAAHLGGCGARELADAASILGRGEGICFAGMGGSRYAAMPVALFLSERGLPAFTADAAEALYYGTIPRENAVALVSRSGRTVEVVKLACALRQKGRRLVGITNCPDSPLAEQCEVCIRVAGDVDTGVSIGTYTAGTLTLLYLGAALAGYGDLAREAVAMVDELAAALPGWEADASAWDLSGAALTVFLGRGYALASARSACLLFQELARQPAAWYGAAEFRQGPIEVFDERAAAVIFAPAGRTRDLNAQLARDILRTGGRVVVVGHGEHAAGVHSVPLPEMPEYLAPVLQIVPVQLAAQAIASGRDHRPGEFRFAAPTTESERRLRGEGGRP